jgi:hypothetical protein
MSTPWTERNGGIWPSRASAKDKLVYEEYVSAHDAFVLIWQRESDCLFEAEYLVKGKAEPQWSLLFWENVAEHGVYESQTDAHADIKAFMGNYRRR